MNISTEPQFSVNRRRRRRAPGSAFSRHRNYTVPVKRVIGLGRTTPLLPWKFTDDPPAPKPMSARELAAGLWRLGLSDGTRVEQYSPQNVFALQQQLLEAKSLRRKLEDKKASSSAPCHRRECKKNRTLIANMNNKLRTERHNQKRVEKMNSSLVTELASARIRAKTLERAEEGLAIKFQEEMEQERKMLRMAHVWREERVQMKLAEARLVFEDKYCYMNKLIAELEAFVHTSIGPPMELRRAALIRRAVRSVDVRDNIIRQFSHASFHLEGSRSTYGE